MWSDKQKKASKLESGDISKVGIGRAIIEPHLHAPLQVTSERPDIKSVDLAGLPHEGSKLLRHMVKVAPLRLEIYDPVAEANYPAVPGAYVFVIRARSSGHGARRRQDDDGRTNNSLGEALEFRNVTRSDRC